MSLPREVARWLTRFELPLLTLVLLAGAIATSILPAALAVAAVFWFVRWMANGRLTLPTPADWPLGLLLLGIPITLWATALPDVTWPQVYRLLAGVALYSAIANWATSRGRLRLLVAGLVAAGLLLAVSAPVSVQWIVGAKLGFIPNAVYQRLPLLLSDAIHPNVMAGALAILTPLPAAALLFSWRASRWQERALMFLACLVMLAVLVLTKSRGGLLGSAAALVILVTLRWRYGWLIVPAGGIGAAFAAMRIGAARIIEMLAATGSLSGLEGRLEVWSRALYMIEDFPFTGIGMGTFQQVANAMYPFFIAGPDASVPHAHNLFLQVAVDLGLPGLLAWLALFLLVCVAGWQIYRGGRRAGDGWSAGLGAGLICSQVALATHGMVDAVTWGTRPSIIVWAIWGIAMAALNGQTNGTASGLKE